MGKLKKKLIVLFSFIALTTLLSIHVTSASAATNAKLSSGVEVTNTISANEVDSYVFTTSQDGEIYVTLDKSFDGMYVELYDAYGNKKGYDYFYNGGGAAVFGLKAVKGTYYVKVYPYDWYGISSSSYNLKVTYPGEFKRNASTFEPNETVETAYPLTNGKIYTSKLESSIDVDKYKFTTSKDGQIYITLDQSSDGAYLELYDANGNQQAYDYYYNGGSSATIGLIATKGTYYVKVKPYDWNATTSMSYRLKATYAAPFTRDANLESNDTRDTAYPIISGKSYTSNSFSYVDNDYFKISTSRSGNVKVTLDNSSDGYYLTLYDIYGNQKTYDYFYSGGASATLDLTLDKGTYFIKVSPYDWNGITSSNYRIVASYQDKIPTVSSVSTQSTSITGSAETGAKVYAYVGSKLIGSTTAVSGKYKIGIAKQTAKKVISVYIVDKDGIQSRSKNVTVIDKTPTVNSVSNLSTSVTGGAETGAKVYAYVGTKLIGSTTAVNGKYTIKIVKQKANSVISVYIVDQYGVKSASRSVKVTDKIAPVKPTVNKVTSKSVYVSGKTEASATVYIYNGTKYVASGKADSKGNYNIKINVQKKGSYLKVYAMDAAKNKSATNTVTVY